MTNGWMGNMLLSSNEPNNLNLGENIVLAIMAWLDQLVTFSISSTT